MRVAALLASVSLIVASCGMPAFAETQEQYADTNAELTLEVDHAGDVSGAAVAGSNSYTSTATGASVVIPGYQYSEGDATASTNAKVWHAHGDVALSSTATGNGATASASHGDVILDRQQGMFGATNASVNVQTGSSGGAYSSAAAAGNVTNATSQYGLVDASLLQASGGAVNASVEADHCCVGWTTSADASASANAITAAGSTTTMLTNTQQYSYGPGVNASVDLYAGYAGDAIGSAAASGNALAIDNQWGYVNAAAVQRNWSDATAQSYVTLGGDFLGTGSASAYGVGNAASVSNAGSDTVVNVEQLNDGAIGAYAALAGQGGDQAVASSAAYGNVITASLCVTCNEEGVPSLNAHSVQTNSGSIYATSTIETAGARHVTGSAVAVGNAASYSVSGY